VGSTVVAALKQNRKGFMVDKENVYSQVARDRIKQLYNGTLRYRPIGTPVYKPTGKEKVSQVPEEWKDVPKIYSDDNSR
jgi:adenine-specific DNA-methyltransferase